MHVRTAVACLCLALGLGVAAEAAAQKAPVAPQGPNTKAIAAQLVKQALVKPGDVVFITGDHRDLGLAEDIFIEVRKAGGFGLLLLQRETLRRRYYDEVPEAQDGKDAALWLKLWPLATAEIAIEGSEFPGLLKHVQHARLAANAKKWEPVTALYIKRGLRVVRLGNGLYPTTATAKLLGVTKEQLAKIFWDGVAVEPARLKASADAVQAVLAKGKVARVTNPNGTDVTMKIAARPVMTSDGIFTAAKLKKGGSAAWTWLPAGEVYLAPVPRTMEGKVVVDRIPYEDGEVLGLTLTVKAGKISSMTAKPGAAFDRFKARYDAALGRKDEVGVLDVGVNPAVSIPKGSKLLTWVAAGMVSFMVGENTWAGGDNNVGYGLPLHLPGSTLTVDGKPLVENGVLKVAPTVASK